MDKLGVAIVGCGTVGSGVACLLLKQTERLTARAGRPLELRHVVVRDLSRPRGTPIPLPLVTTDFDRVLADPNVDVVVELIGGTDVARDRVLAALTAGKHVVTANKALLAEYGDEVFRTAREAGQAVAFEASVAGGIPIIAAITQSLTANQITQIQAILNGTCNFILSEMEAREQPFAQVLADAQARGFAEADPTTDVGGFDAGHKIAILAALAFDAAPNFDAVEIEGIDRVDLIDIHLAHELGYRIKLIASASRQGEGASVRVRPGLVPLNHPLAQAGGALNALFIEGARIGRIFLQGPGAGAGPTAAAVAADLADLTAGVTRPVFQRPAGELDLLAAAAKGQRHERAYIRLMVKDRAGVLASITDALARSDVSIDSFLQRPAQASGVVPVVLTTHEASEGALQQAGEIIETLDTVLERPRIFRIEDV